jgi:hypothetical protein
VHAHPVATVNKAKAVEIVVDLLFIIRFAVKWIVRFVADKPLANENQSSDYYAFSHFSEPVVCLTARRGDEVSEVVLETPLS